MSAAPCGGHDAPRWPPHDRRGIEAGSARHRDLRRAPEAGALAFALAPACAAPSAAAPAASPEEAAAAQLAARYAPIVVAKDQTGSCDRSGKAYRPVPVETVLDTPEIVLLDGDGHVAARGPGARELAGRGPETSLDFPGNPRRPGCGFEEDFRRFGAGRPDTACAHLATDPSAPGRIVLQYWLFWYFDDYVNTHEGDWEFIQIVFPATSAEGALAAAPTEVGYSQHSGGKRADWTSDALERVGDHPLVYAGSGSHANYYGSNVYLGHSAGGLRVQRHHRPLDPPAHRGPSAALHAARPGGPARVAAVRRGRRGGRAPRDGVIATFLTPALQLPEAPGR